MLLDSYLDFFYAEEILQRLPEVVHKMCEGCLQDSLSQTDHTCINMTKREQLSLYFEDILGVINEEDILLKWRASASTVDNVSSEYLAMYELKLNCQAWRETMKTTSWKYRMIKTILQLINLERCF